MQAADFRIVEAKGGAVLALSGDWTATALGRAPRRLARALQGRKLSAVDLSDLAGVDTVGLLAVLRASDEPLPAKGWSARPEAKRLFDYVRGLEPEKGPPPPRLDPITRSLVRIGQGVFDFAQEMTGSMIFIGRLVMALGAALSRPRTIRWPAWFSLTERAGMDAIPIVAVTNFFIGAVIAFLGADLLTDFGASVFTVDLIAISVLREFAVVITAVLLAGRSASAFAAELGSMKMTQEVDAMQVMGVDPFQALVIPRLMSLLLMLPLLTFVAMVAGLAGGVLVAWAKLDLSPAFFLQRVTAYVPIQHFWVGVSKAPVFAVVIAAIGCRQGFAVRGDVLSLGRRVTAAVVHAIFAIIVIDAIFAMIYLEAGV
ncbi:ABC transporter permease [Brevundimonas sp. 2R-24]|uniref:ABC transporter permease n=1 Tax=Peiella sedimenti TaxID=3061083 RepID=A0ABT8SNW3_9CAUL|nr:ABC transporter permease [Caulobacteraceae bacterium XZ-24]